MINPLRSLLIGALLLAPLAARAETHATCAGFIDSVPTVINTQGTWCLRHDVSTNISVGSAIEIGTNNVTIDCNDFKIGGLAAGIESTTVGIKAISRQNITVRNCSVRGFFTGVQITSGAGHLVEDNRVDNSLRYGLYVAAEHSVTRRNRVFDTGGAPGINATAGIVARADIIDNVVSGVFCDNVNAWPTGIEQQSGSAGIIEGNRVSGLVTAGSGIAIGITAYPLYPRVQGNHVTAQTMTAGIGIWTPGSTSFCLENTVANFQTARQNCGQSVGNLDFPTP